VSVNHCVLLPYASIACMCNIKSTVDYCSAALLLAVSAVHAGGVYSLLHLCAPACQPRHPFCKTISTAYETLAVCRCLTLLRLCLLPPAAPHVGQLPSHS
jgi:hypothetical protein